MVNWLWIVTINQSTCQAWKPLIYPVGEERRRYLQGPDGESYRVIL